MHTNREVSALSRSERSILRSITVGTAALVLCSTLLVCRAPAFAAATPQPGGVIHIDQQLDVSELRVLDVADIAPGYEEAWLVTVINQRNEPVTLGVRVDELHNADNGCSVPGTRVDDTCDSPGELGEHVQLRLGTPGNLRMFSAPLNEAVSGSGQIVTVPARGTAEVVIGLKLPATTGNEVQTDSVSFVLVWRAEAIPSTSQWESEDGVPLQTAAAGTPGPAALALTGAHVMLLAGAAVVLLAGGALLVVTVGSEAGRRSADRPVEQ